MLVEYDDVCPAEAEQRSISQKFDLVAYNKPLPPMTVREFAEALVAETSKASSALVGKALTDKGYTELSPGLGLYIRGAACVKVSEHHVRNWPQQKLMVEQTHEQFLKAPDAFFFLETSQRYLSTPPRGP